MRRTARRFVTKSPTFFSSLLVDAEIKAIIETTDGIRLRVSFGNETTWRSPEASVLAVSQFDFAEPK